MASPDTASNHTLSLSWGRLPKDKLHSFKSCLRDPSRLQPPPSEDPFILRTERLNIRGFLGSVTVDWVSSPSVSLAHSRHWMSVYCAVCASECLCAHSCLTLCNPMHCSPPGSPVHGILQGRTLEWVAIPFSRGSSPPRDLTRVSCVAEP